MDSLAPKTPSQNPKTNQFHSFISNKKEGTLISTPSSSNQSSLYKIAHPLQLSNLNDGNISKKDNEYVNSYSKLPNFKKKTLLHTNHIEPNWAKLNSKKSFVLTLQNESIEIIDLDHIGKAENNSVKGLTQSHERFNYSDSSDGRKNPGKQRTSALKFGRDHSGESEGIAPSIGFQKEFSNSREFIDLTRPKAYTDYLKQEHNIFQTHRGNSSVKNYPEERRQEYRQTSNYKQHIFAIPGKSKSAHEFKDFNAYAPTPFQNTNLAMKDDDLFKSYESDLTKLEKITPPAELKGIPREHQKVGLNWLVDRERGVNKGGIVADEMGLGI